MTASLKNDFGGSGQSDAAGVVLDESNPLSYLYVGGTIVGDIISPIVPYEDYAFDENNIYPEEYAKRLDASKRND